MWHIVVLAPNHPACGCASALALFVGPAMPPAAIKPKGAVRANADPSSVRTKAIAEVQRPIFEHNSKRFNRTLRAEKGAFLICSRVIGDQDRFELVNAS